MIKFPLRLVPFLLILGCLQSVSAQTQQGYTKTRGRLNPDGSVTSGKRLPEVSIIFQDGRTSVLSDEQGAFTFPIRGNTYMLREVRKNGYQLLDTDILSAEHSFSAEIPLVLTLETPDQLLDDQLATERLVRRQVEERLRRKEAELDSLRNSRAITVEEYRQKLQTLYAERAQTEQLVNDMVERYPKIDFDLTDDFYRQVSVYIIDGDLSKADSLLNTKGDLDARIASYHELQTANVMEHEKLAQRHETLARSQHYALQALDDLGKECYNRYEIAKLRFQNDSAAYYIEKRASLDTLNVEWQLEAGLFINNYLANYNHAMSYFQRALRAVQPDDSITRATCYDDVALVYHSMGDIQNTMAYLQKALDIRLEAFGENHPEVASSCNNIGLVYYFSMGDYQNAMEYLQKALDIRLKAFEEHHPDVASSFNSIGVVYDSMGDYLNALTYYQNALDIQLAVFGEKHPDVASSFNVIGAAYHSMGDLQNTMMYLQKALNIRLEAFEEHHPDVASSFNSIGAVYYSIGDCQNAIEYLQKALDIRLEAFGEHHPDVATGFNNIGTAYYSIGDYQNAIKYLQKALDIRLDTLGENHPNVATCYSNIGAVYYSMEDYQNALSYHEKALDILQQSGPADNPDLEVLKDNISSIKQKIDAEKAE